MVSFRILSVIKLNWNALLLCFCMVTISKSCCLCDRKMWTEILCRNLKVDVGTLSFVVVNEESLLKKNENSIGLFVNFNLLCRVNDEEIRNAKKNKLLLKCLIN